MTQQSVPADNDPQWLRFYLQTITPFWQQQVQTLQLVRPDKVNLTWYLHQPEQAKALVLISPGRVEAGLKYQELVWWLAQQDYAVAVLDHRGQGFSDRLSNNPHHGHIDQFEDFVTDLEAVAAAATELCPQLPQYLLAHSMGGAIASLMLARGNHKIEKAVFSAPMLGLDTGRTPKWLAQTIAVSGALLNRWVQPRKPWYFIGMEDYRTVPFDENELTHSEARYQMFRDLYDQHPQVQLGGPTFNWVAQAFAAVRAAQQQAAQISIPILMLQAGADTIVDNQGQRQFVQQLPHAASRIEVIKGARHELFIEADPYRQQALTHIQAWFNQAHP
ncbi:MULTISPECIES: alpha/beta fold hydrolase [Idiomarinaceae]|uniref:Alpha/beta fold hydrolase n=1 Tax=Pseudidiomarina fusca TaxID=2965078 RepID=A0ABU3KX51_9GAMM|nr:MULTISPECIES: alpha/beta fold hydrolase [Idiomarinaceae]MDT7526075.1 alpha/beta fold hydrolase [Pseudidiomarina sp. GXY010]MRJ41645.1 alpha/beta fold hydrolase [Idiomarina sp. FeN1]NCU57635.1 alpha/beta fold hydrolase [Idiomarina sp. FenA--70]NCU60187.1 alpha/beta fold hydrolase [Idiomarina sp. FenBw--71]UUN13464.1 alpha/beta fold hydrolase [Idiomarina loihiensis]